MTCAATPNVTFLPASADGPLPLILPDGREICPLGLVRALASLSARQVKAMGLQTSGISGRPGSTSSASAALTSSLASRLQAQFGTGGSILFRQTWKRKATPSGALYWEHTASVHRTSGSGCIGWPTPRANDSEKRGNVANDPRNGVAAASMQAAPWATPQAGDEKWRISTIQAAERRIASGKQVSLECMAHGVSARVVRLRGYGNAIVPQAAAAFVGAFLDSAAGSVRAAA